MNLYESIKNHIKESEEYYAKCIKNGTDINTEYFSSQSEAEQFAEKATKEHEYDEVDVYKSSNDDCIGVYEVEQESNTIQETDNGGIYYLGKNEYVIVKPNDEDSNVLEFYIDDNKYGDEVIPKDWDENKIRTFAGLVSRHEGPRGDRDFVKEVNDKFKESEEGERVDLFLRNDYGDWIDYLWYYPSSGKFFATFETVSHAEAWKRLNDPQVKQAVKDSWGDDTEKVYKEMIDYLKSCDDLNESELKESYDLVNVVEDTISSLERLKGLIDDGTFNELSTVSKEIELIIKNTKENMNEAW